MELTSSLIILEPGISCWNAQRVGALNPEESNEFQRVLNKMGQLSSQAQGLSSPLTTTEKLRETSDNVYIVCNDKADTIQGFLRLGEKHLFLYPDDGGSMFEEDVLCLLDFYVHETVQRKGLGIALFSSALKSEGVNPTEIAYDRPSPKLPLFLSKHLRLENGLDQPNRFMVFKEFFGGAAAARSIQRQGH
ncbi:unnamed protein product [Sphacelaria rigidula]